MINVETNNDRNTIVELMGNIGKGAVAFAQFANQISLYIKRPDVAQGIANLLDNIKNFPSYEKTIYKLLAQYGWYANWQTPFGLESPVVAAVEGKIDILDEFMIEHLKKDWPNLVIRILQNYPNRAKILETSFHLHEQGNFIASIPLLLSQCDGIVFQKYNHSLFKLKNYEMVIKNSVQKAMENGEIEKDGYIDILYEALRITNDFATFSENSNKKLAPNRHGILHGLENHLDYGTEINSYKVFSLLSYLDSMFNNP